MKTIHIVCGQTATGKTNLALALAKKINGELLSADSRQVYRHLTIISGKDIGTGLYNSKEGYYTVDGIRLWLYDLVDPRDTFSAYEWASHARKRIEAVFSYGKTPIIVGGTWLYVRSLLNGIDATSGPQSDIREVADSMSVDELQNIVRDKNPLYWENANNSDRNNPRRLIRAWEKSLHVHEHSFEGIGNFYTVKGVILYAPKEEIEVRIAKRVRARIEEGAFEEVEWLLKNGYSATDPGLQAPGYRQIIAYCNGEISREEAIETWIMKERQYAKRQLLFMRNQPWPHINVATTSLDECLSMLYY